MQCLNVNDGFYCTEERIARLHNNAVLTNDDQDRCLALFNKYFFNL